MTMDTPTTQPVTTGVLPLLADPQGYLPCAWELGPDKQRLAYWLALFRNHFPSLMEEAVNEGRARGLDAAEIERRADQAAAVFYRYLDALAQQPSKFGRLDILAICVERERVLREFGFDDAYRLAKEKENHAAMALLPGVLADLDALPNQERAMRLIEGVFAGNIFDLGVSATLELYKSGGADFHETRSKLKPRPWLFDDLDRWLDRWHHGQVYQSAVLFVDNAGFDIVLGMIPLARALLKRGTGVVMTANTTASLNDITHAELEVMIGEVARWDATIRDALAKGSLELVPSGNGTPLIDLSKCSSALNEAVSRRAVDLVVLEGMGRALESNFEATFTCDVLKIAMVKDIGVASVLGGEVFDLALKFDQAGDYTNSN